MGLGCRGLGLWASGLQGFGAGYRVLGWLRLAIYLWGRKVPEGGRNLRFRGGLVPEIINTHLNP